MRAAVSVAVLAAWLAGCATPAGPATPATRESAVPVETVLTEAMSLLMARGYVIRHADADLGRLEAVIARWPGYRVRLEVEAADGATLISMTAYRDGRPLPPRLVEPLMTDLNGRLLMRP
ncbi:hypothetical protein ACFPTY_18810 [Halomonas beimenensis]|uniref:Lipoprotein n=1 Tax=Halomonas beimenensis TaxID=475662 RepID=A0A291P324_9GAMM|nr:hypothetical protein [Halomonas beimenensis]ATJ81270.1 hypothetical protein BEI_0283 [Halomonas beimenensis]